MSCNCGCHDNKPPATGWRKYMPLIVGVVVVAAFIAGALLKKDDASKATGGSATGRTTTVAKP